MENYLNKNKSIFKFGTGHIIKQENKNIMFCIYDIN